MANKKDIDVIELAKEAYGFSDRQLLRELELAEEGLKDEPVDDEALRIGYEKILSEIKRRGIKPEYKEIKRRTTWSKILSFFRLNR